MKKYAILCFILLAFTKINAQEINFNKVTATLNTVSKHYTISESYFEQEKPAQDKALRKAKQLKIAGLFFTSLGAAGVLATTPFVVLYSAMGRNTWVGGLVSSYVGIIGYSPSAACLITGIPMAVVGAKKVKKIHRLQGKEF